MNNTYLTTGNVFKSISIFAVPMLIGNILQQLYNIIDTWVVGKYINSDALAAVGAVFALMVFITSILIGLCMGSGVVFAQDYGRKDFAVLQRRIGTAFIGIGIITVVITVLTACKMDLLLQWLNIPAEIYDTTLDYLRIMIVGIPAVFVYNFFAAYLKSLGNSVTPLVYLAVSAVVNIILDLLFVLSFGMGVKGAALATVIAQYISGLGCGFHVILKSEYARNAFTHISIRAEDIRILFSYSFYTCLQQSVMNLGILMVQGIVNSYGTVVMTAFAAGVKIDAFAYMPAQEYGNAFSTFLAQNYGANKMDRFRQGIRVGIITSAVYCAAASLVLWIFAKKLMLIFIPESKTEIINIGVQYLHIEGAFYIGIGILFLLYGLYRAMGRPQMSLILTIISLGTRVVIAKAVSVSDMPVSGIWWAVPIGWFLADTVGIICYLFYRKSLKR